jgi:16S rRNA (cytidine1402-2'-O)-methyltransferase
VTKVHEEFRRAALSELSASLEEKPVRGEITLLIGAPLPGQSTTRDTTQSLADRVDELIRQAKLDRKEALKLAAKERGLTRREAYSKMVESHNQEE